MMHRRVFLALAGTAGLLLTLPPGLRRALAQGSPDAATSFLQGVTQKLVGIVNGPGTTAAKQPQMQSIIFDSVDVDGVAKFCLGRHWQDATAAQRAQYVQLFHAVLVNSITGHLGEYRGVTIALGRASPRNGDEVVSSTVTRPNNPPTPVDWVIGTVAGTPKIVDVLAEGTSLRLTQRADYASYLAQHGNKVQALIDAMQRQAQAS